MRKKLWVITLALPFLLWSVVSADAGVIKKPVSSAENRGVLSQEVEKIQIPAKGRVVSIPVENVSRSVSIQRETEQQALDQEDDVIPVKLERARKPALIRKHGYLYPGNSEIVPLGSNRDDLPHGYLFNYDDESTEYYLGGGVAGDEWGIWFQSPQAACSLYAVEWQFYGGVPGGTINLNVMEAGTVWPDTIPNADSIAVEDVFGTNLMGTGMEFPLEMEATSDWEQFVFPIWGFDIDVGRDIFWIHWTKTGDYPMLLADSDNPGDYLRTWSYEPNQDGDEKWSHYGTSVGIEAMVRCEVVFYEDPPPTVIAKQTNDTYSNDAITLTADAWDNALDPDLEGIASGNLIYSVDGVSDTLVAAVSGDTAVGFTLTATVPAGVTGDVVEYYFEAWDLADLYGRSFPALSFERTEPVYPDADVLVVRDGVSSSQRDLLELVLDDNNFIYELWDAGTSHGIDASVVGYGWNNILIYGWGSTTVPMFAADVDPGYANFIDGGGNLFLTDMDWMCASSAGCGDATFTWAAGDFAWDYFGLTSGENDPGTIEIVPITGQNVAEFDGMSLELDHAAYLLGADAGWIDYITPETANDIFTDGSNTVGATMDHSGTGGGKAVYLSFMADAAGDTLETGEEWDYSQFATLIDSVISYFGAVSPPAAALVGEGSTRYGVASGTNSATVNATALDGDGTLTSVVVKWSVDAVDTSSQAMTLVTGDQYTATLDLTGFTDTSTVVYWVEATDNDATTTVSAAGSFWGTDFTPTAGTQLLYIFDSSYPTNVAYGVVGADSTVKANMTAAGLVYDAWSVGIDYLPDFGTVLDNYDAVIYAGVLDWTLMPEAAGEHTLTEFVDNGGYLLYGSEEVLGTYTNWEDLSFSAGHFAYDVLGVEWVGNDYNYDSVLVYDATSLTPGLATGNIALDVASMPYTGSMADLCDPVGYGTVDQLPSPFLGEPVDYYASSQGDYVAFLGFNLSMLPTDQQQILFGNFADWAGITVGVDDVVSMLPETFALRQNYPNPFNPVTNLKFELPEKADVKLVIYNLMGQQVTTLVNRELKAGYHNVLWKGTDTFGRPMSSGVYIYRIKADNYTSSKKMLLLK